MFYSVFQEFYEQRKYFIISNELQVYALIITIWDKIALLRLLPDHYLITNTAVCGPVLWWPRRKHLQDASVYFVWKKWTNTSNMDLVLKQAMPALKGREINHCLKSPPIPNAWSVLLLLFHQAVSAFVKPVILRSIPAWPLLPRPFSHNWHDIK